MAALMWIGGFLLAVLLVGFLRIGIIISYEDSFIILLRVGLLQFTMFPQAKKKKLSKNKTKKIDREKAEEGKQSVQTKAEKPKQAKNEKKETSSANAPAGQLTFNDWMELLRVASRTLYTTAWRASRRIRIDPLRLVVVFGGDNPADAANAYGAAHVVTQAFQPVLRDLFFIPNPSLRYDLDFQAEKTVWNAHVGLSLRLCDLVSIGFTQTVPLLKWYLQYKKGRRKADNQHHEETESSKIFRASDL